MEYKYHPAFKHLTFFVIIYLFLRNQEIMSNELLFINSVIITVFLIILDHLFIHNHLTPLQSLSDQYFDDMDIIELEKELELEKVDDDESNKSKKSKKSKKIKKSKINNENVDNISEKMVIRDQNEQQTPVNKFKVNNNHNDYVHIGLNNYVTEQPAYPYERNSYNDNIDEYPEYLAYNE
jgi:hypothetical protein